MIHLLQMNNNYKGFDRFQMTFVIEEEEIVLRDFIRAKGISKRTLTVTKYAGGQLLVNGVERTVRHICRKGDVVTVILPPERRSEGLIPEEGPLSIMYEDDAFLIVHKPAGQATIPSRDQPAGTLANVVAWKFQEQAIQSTVHVVTRLDRQTSGLVCIAKNRHIHHLLNRQMEKGIFDRQYLAIVEGHVKPKKFTIERPIGRKEGSIIERTIRADGQYARTDVEVIQYGIDQDQRYTVVALQLYTGRTHQIRVHMQSIGHPLLGDELYGGSCQFMHRQALHCHILQFSHPLTEVPCRFTSPLPEDFSSFITVKSV